MNKGNCWKTLVAGILLFGSFSGSAWAQAKRERRSAVASSGETWSFAASGDSRNCGDVVMPAIAAGVKRDDASFYWHLGDFRAIYKFDEDMQHDPKNIAEPMDIIDYERHAWSDFLQNQIAAFDKTAVFLGIGNHETIMPKTREQYLIQFADWIDSPALREQRLKDDPQSHSLTTYYHWNRGGVDFINLDNATADQFDRAQMAWFSKVLHSDTANPEIRTIVLGMHEALPESISKGHSMNESAAGTESGHRVYTELLKAQNDAHKRVYVLASHSHYFMDGIFNTDYWRANGGVLPGWIVGTAGAERYALPANAGDARAAATNVYGYLLGTVKPNGEIDFAFKKLSESDVPAGVAQRYAPQFVHWCFAENSEAH